MSTSSSTPLSTMKTIQKRLYHVLPRVPPPTVRVRSNSVSSRSLYTVNSTVSPLTFFDTPSASPRHNVLTTSRIGIEARGDVETGQSNLHQSHLPFSLALTPPQHNYTSSSPPLSGQYSIFPYSSLVTPSPSTLPVQSVSEGCVRGPKRQRYQLDIGAYGIPKRCRANVMSGRERQLAIGQSRRMLHTQSAEDGNLAVQVGEDAYFIRDNAMGVADGVGGWARVKHPEIPSSTTPSGLFSRRLMHFCSAEFDSSPSVASHSHPNLPSHHAIFTSFDSLIPQTPSSLPSSSESSPWYWSDPISNDLGPTEIQEQLDESLEELEDGIDILMILERAYQNTLKAHVVPSKAENNIPISSQTPPPPPPLSPPSSLAAPFIETPSVPLLAGSSTALLAVLDHVPRRPSDTQDTSSNGVEYDAVVKIAHVGDCMGMLVRRDEIAWRSEEMWWSFNTPVQLGPSTPTTPSTSAHLFTLPVQADDILILASDGLSDNLWDEDILDEVVRFRREYLATSPLPLNSSATPAPHGTAADRIRWRRALASSLSEALCSRGRRASELRGDAPEAETPFARRAKEEGKNFKGGKNDDISVVVAVISPVADLVEHLPKAQMATS